MEAPPLTYLNSDEQARAVHVASQGIVETLASSTSRRRCCGNWAFNCPKSARQGRTPPWPLRPGALHSIFRAMARRKGVPRDATIADL